MLRRVQQEFYWPGVHECVIRYVTYASEMYPKELYIAKAPMGKLPLINTPF